jgi:hypothetical protein
LGQLEDGDNDGDRDDDGDNDGDRDDANDNRLAHNGLMFL